MEEEFIINIMILLVVLLGNSMQLSWNEVEPVQKSSNIYFITYNIMLIINGMVGMKFS